MVEVGAELSRARELMQLHLGGCDQLRIHGVEGSQVTDLRAESGDRGRMAHETLGRMVG